GISDANGICTIQMPDILVVCFTMNPQSLIGSAEAARGAVQQRPNRPLRVLPVPMRLEVAEKALLERRLDNARRAFEPFVALQDAYWQEVGFFYTPFYSFNEVLAPFGDQHARADSLLASAQRLTRYITSGRVVSTPSIPEADRHTVLGRYEH